MTNTCLVRRFLLSLSLIPQSPGDRWDRCVRVQVTRDQEKGSSISSFPSTDDDDEEDAIPTH